MKKLKRYIQPLVMTVLLWCSILQVPTVHAQCAMCRMAPESNLNGGGSAGRGLNAGILYMLAAPYLIVGTIGFIWWRNHRKFKEEE